MTPGWPSAVSGSGRVPAPRPAGRARDRITSLLASRFHPRAFQWVTTAFLFLIAALSIAGPTNTGQNFGASLTWTLWWPLLPLSFVVAGRFWCATCPLGWLTDRVRNGVGLGLPVPGFLRRRGPWVIAGAFVLMTYVDETWRVGADARRTGYLLLALLVVVIFFAAIYERRTFCRHVCFISAFAGNYSRAGIVQLRANAEDCLACGAEGCYQGTDRAEGCPVFLRGPAIGDPATCQLCGACVKNCPRDAIAVTLRAPASGLWDRSPRHLADAVLAAVVMGAVLIEQTTRLRAWTPLTEAAGRLLSVDPYIWYPLVYAALLAAFIAVPLGGLIGAGAVSRAAEGAGGRDEWLRNVAGFGHAMIPLALAGHLACGAGPLLALSRSLPLAALAVAGWFPAAVQPAWLPSRGVVAVQLALLAAGAATSLYVTWRISRTRAARRGWLVALPHALLIVGLFAADAWLVAASLPA